MFGRKPGLGTVVRVSGDIVTIEGDAGTFTVCRHELIVCRQPPGRAPMRRLPYGLWTCADGRQVLFDRNYKPLFQRTPDGTVSVADPDEWVPFVAQAWFYQDSTGPAYDRRSLARCEADIALELRAIVLENAEPAGRA